VVEEKLADDRRRIGERVFAVRTSNRICFSTFPREVAGALLIRRGCLRNTFLCRNDGSSGTTVMRKNLGFCCAVLPLLISIVVFLPCLIEKCRDPDYHSRPMAFSVVCNDRTGRPPSSRRALNFVVWRKNQYVGIQCGRGPDLVLGPHDAKLDFVILGKAKGSKRPKLLCDSSGVSLEGELMAEFVVRHYGCALGGRTKIGARSLESRRGCEGPWVNVGAPNPRNTMQTNHCRLHGRPESRGHQDLIVLCRRYCQEQRFRQRQISGDCGIRYSRQRVFHFSVQACPPRQDRQQETSRKKIEISHII